MNTHVSPVPEPVDSPFLSPDADGDAFENLSPVMENNGGPQFTPPFQQEGNKQSLLNQKEKENKTQNIPSRIFLYEPSFVQNIPFLKINENKSLYLEVFRKFLNPYYGLFSSDLSIFSCFPFNAKEILIQIKSKNRMGRNAYPPPTTFDRYDHLLLHYYDALHLQFYCIIALAAKVCR